jgi:hypothetical protein
MTHAVAAWSKRRDERRRGDFVIMVGCVVKK